MKKQRVTHNIPFQFAAFAGFHSFYSLLQPNLNLFVKFSILQAKGQDIAYHYYYLVLWHSPVNTRLHYALNYTVNIIYFVPHIPLMVIQQPQRVDMMGKKLERQQDFVLTRNMRQWLQITHILQFSSNRYCL